MEKEIEILETLLFDYEKLDYRFGNMLGCEQTNAIEYLIQAYKEQQAELEKKDKIIDLMSKQLYIEGYCKKINCKKCKAESFTDCIKQYFEKKEKNNVIK